MLDTEIYRNVHTLKSYDFCHLCFMLTNLTKTLTLELFFLVIKLLAYFNSRNYFLAVLLVVRYRAILYSRYLCTQQPNVYLKLYCSTSNITN